MGLFIHTSLAHSTVSYHQATFVSVCLAATLLQSHGDRILQKFDTLTVV